MNKKLDLASLKEQLDQTDFPNLYMFKFIVNKGKESEVAALFPSNEVTMKLSKNGNYISVTAKVMMPSSNEIIRIYEEAYKIEGVISL